MKIKVLAFSKSGKSILANLSVEDEDGLVTFNVTGNMKINPDKFTKEVGDEWEIDVKPARVIIDKENVVSEDTGEIKTFTKLSWK